ncbi:MAG: AbgT family transporter [Thermaurantimonas sp.]
MNKSSRIDRFLSLIERAGNALPHPATLFFLFAVFVILLSGIVSIFDIQVIHPGNGTVIKPVNLISREGLDLILTKMVTNFTGFAPLGTVLVALLGIGIAEGSGLIGVVLRKIVLSSPPRLLTFVVVSAGVLSNTASEVGYVLLVPLAAIIFESAGRHPLAGLAAAFAGVSGGYSANLLLGTIDPLLAGLSEEAARIIDKDYVVNPACNYYFMAVSTFLIAFVGTFVTERIVEPRLGKNFQRGEGVQAIENLSVSERRGLKYALVTFLIFTGLLLVGLLPEKGVLRGSDGSILKSPFMNGIVALVFISAAVLGIAYGIGARTIKDDNDVMKGMSKSMETLGSYIVLVFFAAQFVAYFNWTNLGLITAVKGAEGLKALISTLGLENKYLMAAFIMVPFIFLSAVINLVMGSASAKWAIMAPVFIPMLMLLGYSPEFTQVAYRIGDSVTNIISPMMSYFALIVAFIQRFQPKAGIGTVVSLMLPYSVFFLIGWILLLFVWILLGLPIGPGVSLFYS